MTTTVTQLQRLHAMLAQLQFMQQKLPQQQAHLTIPGQPQQKRLYSVASATAQKQRQNRADAQKSACPLTEKATSSQPAASLCSRRW